MSNRIISDPSETDGIRVSEAGLRVRHCGIRRPAALVHQAGDQRYRTKPISGWRPETGGRSGSSDHLQPPVVGLENAEQSQSDLSRVRGRPPHSTALRRSSSEGVSSENALRRRYEQGEQSQLSWRTTGKALLGGRRGPAAPNKPNWPRVPPWSHGPGASNKANPGRVDGGQGALSGRSHAGNPHGPDARRGDDLVAPNKANSRSGGSEPRRWIQTKPIWR